jgi:hypothetical protein
MKALLIGAAIAAGLTTGALAQTAVNIVYPIDGEQYPIGPDNPNQSAIYQAFSFSATCSGGGHHVEWYLDGNMMGQIDFYDEVSVQQVDKIDIGKRAFDVKADCGDSSVSFAVKDQ